MHTRISIISTFVSDLMLLALMLSGILRWKGSRESSGTWWLLYKQVSLSLFRDYFDLIAHADC
jgi:hypothetical protein